MLLASLPLRAAYRTHLILLDLINYVFYIITYLNPEKNKNPENHLFLSSTVDIFLTGFRNFSETTLIIVNWEWFHEILFSGV